MSSDVTAPPVSSYRLSPLLHALPWIMLATAVRLLGFSLGMPVLALIIVSDAVILVAFLVGAQAMIAIFQGRTQLGALRFGDQLRLAHRVLVRVVLLLAIATVLVSLVRGWGWGRHMLLGFDGIAYDQFTRLGIVWSSLLAPIVLLMVLQAGSGRPVSLVAALREFWRRRFWLIPAVAAVAVFAGGLSMVQGYGRGLVKVYWDTSDDGEVLKGFVYFTFIFCFAAFRLLVTLAILTFALRWSYRREVGPSLPQ